MTWFYTIQNILLIDVFHFVQLHSTAFYSELLLSVVAYGTTYYQVLFRNIAHSILLHCSTLFFIRLNMFSHLTDLVLFCGFEY